MLPASGAKSGGLSAGVPGRNADRKLCPANGHVTPAFAACEPLCAAFRTSWGVYPKRGVSATETGVSEVDWRGLKTSRRKRRRSLNAAASTSARSAGSFRGFERAFLKPVFYEWNVLIAENADVSRLL